MSFIKLEQKQINNELGISNIGKKKPLRNLKFEIGKLRSNRRNRNRIVANQDFINKLKFRRKNKNLEKDDLQNSQELTEKKNFVEEIKDKKRKARKFEKRNVGTKNKLR